MRRFDFSKRRIHYSFTEIPKYSFERLANLTCTRLIRRFCIPKRLAASASPVSTQNVCTSCSRFERNAVPLGFCCGGFSSTAGYVPGNEAHFAMSDLAPFGCSFPNGVARFYPNNSKSLATFLSKAFRLRCRA